MKHVLAPTLVFLALGGLPTAWAATPETALATLNIHTDESKGASWRALVLMDVGADKAWSFPLKTIAGGPVPGQPMHAVLSADKKSVYITMGGSKDLPLRLVTVSVDWSDADPKVTVTRTTEVLKANTLGPQPPSANQCGNAGMTQVDLALQEGHGPSLSPDGKLLFFSELNNNRLRVFNTQTGEFVGAPLTHPTLKTPHGVYPNPSLRYAVSTQYQLNGNQVSLWKVDPKSGEMSFDRAIAMTDGKTRCAFTHTVAWINEHEFYTGCTQESDQGVPESAERSVWLVDTRKGSARAVLRADQLKEGVSDVAVTQGKLYVAEGNVVKEGVPPGHVSVWDIRNRAKPVLVKRLSANQGLPASFGDAHELAVTADGRYVFTQSYRSGHLIKIDSRTDTAVSVWDASRGLPMPHGLSTR